MKRPVKGGARIALGALTAILIDAALTGLLSLLIVRGTIDEKWILPCVYFFACVAAFVGTGVAADAVRGKAELVCAAVFWAAVLGAGLIGGGRIDAKKAVLMLLPILLGAVCAVRLRAGKERGARRRRSRK